MIVDAHNHPDWLGHDLAMFLENMAEHDIDRTWLLSWESPSDEYDHGFDDRVPGGPDGPVPFTRCLAYAERAPGKFVLGFAPDPRRPDAIDRLQSAIELHGVRVYGELKVRMTYDHADALRMFRFCGEKRLPVVVHIDYDLDGGFWYGGGIEAFERAIETCPDTIFLGHGPGFWAHISGDDQFDRVAYPCGPVQPGGKLIAMLRRYPNLYCDWSAGSGCNAISRDPEFGREFLLEFADRVLFARDCFDNRHQELLNAVGLPDEALAKIYSGNALELVPLERDE